MSVLPQGIAKFRHIAECARQAGMSPQRWFNIEAKSKRPYRQTCEAVAKGLDISLVQVMEAAGLTLGSAEDTLAHRMEKVLELLSPHERARVEAELEKDATQYVELLKPDVVQPK